MKSLLRYEVCWCLLPCLTVPIVSLKMWWKMVVALDIISKTTNAATVGGSSSSLRSGEWLVRKQRHHRSAVIGETAIGRYCPRLANFRTVGATIRESTCKRLEREVLVRPKPKSRRTVQMDELWSFVDRKGNQQWMWLAIDVETLEIIGCHIGDRSVASAQALWQSMPGVYRQCAVIYSDLLVCLPDCVAKLAASCCG